MKDNPWVSAGLRGIQRSSSQAHVGFKGTRGGVASAKESGSEEQVAATEYKREQGRFPIGVET